jgi:recombination protein RecR
MNAIEKLSSYFNEFPGIGPRQAKRFVYFLLRQSPTFLNELAERISEIKENIKVCSSCFRYYTAQGSLCTICSDPSRSDDVLIVVEKDVDADNIEKSGIHEGFYFILGGSVPILDKEPERKVRIFELKEKLKKYGSKIKELILATSLTPEGENTSEYIVSSILELQKEFDFKISHLGRGLSTGTEIEYSDKDTIKEAFKNRH